MPVFWINSVVVIRNWIMLKERKKIGNLKKQKHQQKNRHFKIILVLAILFGSWFQRLFEIHESCHTSQHPQNSANLHNHNHHSILKFAKLMVQNVLKIQFSYWYIVISFSANFFETVKMTRNFNRYFKIIRLIQNFGYI